MYRGREGREGREREGREREGREGGKEGGKGGMEEGFTVLIIVCDLITVSSSSLTGFGICSGSILALGC